MPALSVAPSATPAPELLRVTAGSQGANLRREPGTGGALLGTLRNGAELTVVGADRVVNGQAWRNVRSADSDEGWITDAAVETIATAVPTAPGTPITPGTPDATGTPPSASAAPGATGTPSAAGTPGVAGVAGRELTATPTPFLDGELDATVVATPTATATFGTTGGSTEPVTTPTTVPSATPTPTPTTTPERARVSDTQGVNLRAEPGNGGRLVTPLRLGTELTVVGPDREIEGRVWRNVRDAAGETGWVVSEALASLSPTPTPAPLATTAATSTGAATRASATSPGGTPTTGETDEPTTVIEPTATPTDPAAPCRSGQVKGDATSGLFYLPGHPEYSEIRGRVRCFDEESRARASGFLAAP